MVLRMEKLAEPIPGYRLLERLGTGGFGEVWKCEAPGGILKAIKFVHGSLHSTNGDDLHAQQELKALNRVKSVRHPYVLSLERYDIIDGQLVIVMELADRNLWDRFKECRSQGLPGIPREELLRYMEETAEALDVMRTQYQLQHLDIKPQNLFLVHNHIKVADFGLVKDLEGVRGNDSSGVTPLYAAPETFEGQVSGNSDQYSLAIVYQELLTGQRPFRGTNVRQLLMQHLNGEPDLSPLPPGDRGPIGRALAKKAEDRFASCTDLVVALRAAQAADILSGEVGPAPGSSALVITPISGGSQARTRDDMPLPSRDTLHESNQPWTALGPRASLPASPAETAWPRVLPTLPPQVPLRSPEGGVPLQVPAAVPARSRSVEAPGIVQQPVPPPQPEHKGDGVLFPALIIGIGHLGLGVLGQLRRTLQERCGGRSELPNVRLLYIDTDPQRVREATLGDPDMALTDQEVILARLNRPFHYLKPARGRPAVDSWLNLKMLYRIPREQSSTEGIRALGRLAFVDNYPQIASRLQAQLEACTAASALSTAREQTQLGLRTNRPRVYVIASLAGGTGGGMFLDAAYVVRAKLRRMGWNPAEVVSLLLLPPANAGTSAALAAGNAYAALTELWHFSAPSTSFAAAYQDADWPVADDGAPFSRCVFMQLPPPNRGDRAVREVLARAGDYLGRELTTPLGRAADEARGRLAPKVPESKPRFSTFGLHWISWPRYNLVQRVATRLAHQLAQEWLAKGRPGLAEAVQAWVAEQWAQRRLSFEGLVQQLQDVCDQALGQPADAAFDARIAPLAGKGGLFSAGVEPAALLGVLEQLQQLVGRPEVSILGAGGAPRNTVSLSGTEAQSASNQLPVLVEALDRTIEPLTAAARRSLGAMIDCLLDAPTFHLAGAEEAVAQVRSALEQMLHSQQQVCQQLRAQAAECHARIHSLLFDLQQGRGWFGRKGKIMAEIIGALRHYPRARLTALLLQKVLQVYRQLVQAVTDHQREVGFCRGRLEDYLREHFKDVVAAARRSESCAGQYLLPGGCKTVAEAVDHVHAQVTPLDLVELDQRVQEAIRRRFTSLADACLDPDDRLADLRATVQQQAEEFVSARLGDSDVAAVYLAQQGSDDRARSDIAGMFDEARPDFVQDVSGEVRLLALPLGESSDHLRRLAAEALPEVSMIPAASADEIVLYREAPLSLPDLPQLGPESRAAYERMCALEHFTPHIRTDVVQWLRPGESPE
jgi:serine/threonine protein kinase